MRGTNDHLEVPGRHIQGDAVTSHVVHGLVGTDSLALLADDDPELDLVVELLTPQGDLDLLPRSDVGGRRLDKQAWVYCIF